jgi:Spy/CpxP family protein refolding chaperone
MTPEETQRMYFNWMYERKYTSARVIKLLFVDKEWDLLTPEQRREYHEKWEEAMGNLTWKKVKK